MNFFAFPKKVTSDLMSHWIEMKDLTKFDSSLTNQTNRNFMTDMMAESYFILSDHCIACTSWIAIRKIKVDEIFLNADSLSCEHEIDFSKVKILNVFDCSEPDLDLSLF